MWIYLGSNDQNTISIPIWMAFSLIKYLLFSQIFGKNFTIQELSEYGQKVKFYIHYVSSNINKSAALQKKHLYRTNQYYDNIWDSNSRSRQTLHNSRNPRVRLKKITADLFCWMPPNTLYVLRMWTENAGTFKILVVSINWKYYKEPLSKYLTQRPTANEITSH